MALREEVGHGTRSRDILDLVRDAPIFRRFDSETQRELVREADLTSYERGQVVTVPAHWQSALYIVGHGQVRVALASAGGREYDLQRWCRPDVFALEQGAADDTAVTLAYAMEDGTAVCALQYPRVMRAIAAWPAAASEALELQHRRVIEHRELLGHMAFEPARVRLAHKLAGLAEQNGGAALHFTHSELARLVGGTRERVSEDMNRLRQRGLVCYCSADPTHAIVVRDVGGLAKER